MTASHSDLAKLCAEAYKIDEVNKGQDFAFYHNQGDTLIVILKGSTIGEEGLSASRQWQENAVMLAPDLYNAGATVLNYWGWNLPVLKEESYYQKKEEYNTSNKKSAKALAELISKEVKRETRNMIFTGHSRGGMLAIQCALELHARYPSQSVSVVTFAAPIMTMSPEEITFLKDKTVCYKHLQDPVILLDVGGGAELAGFKTITLTNAVSTLIAGHEMETYIAGVEAVESVKAISDHMLLLFEAFQRCQ